MIQIGGKSAPYRESRSPLLDERAAAAWRTLRPMFAHVTVENRCNLACAHCYQTEETHAPDARPLSISDYARVFEDLAQLGVLVLTLSGGEIFLRRDLLDIVALARSKRFAVRLYTSGTLIDEEKADRIRALNVSEVHVSIYSHDPVVHDTFTQRSRSHARSVRALRLLHERGVHTVLKANVLTINVHQIDQLIALARDVGADWQIDPTLKVRMNGDVAPLRYAVEPSVLKELVLKRTDLQSALSMEDAAGICDGNNPRDGGGGMCAAARGLIAIGADGGIYPCAMYPVPVGNVRSESLQDVWLRSRVFDEMRTQSMGTMHDCPSCEVRGACAPCMANAMVEHGDPRRCNASSRQLATATHLLALETVRGISGARPAGANVVSRLSAEP